MIDTIVELAGGRLPVTVGVSSASTRASCAYAEQARDRGAQGVMCLPPLLYPGTTEELGGPLRRGLRDGRGCR